MARTVDPAKHAASRQQIMDAAALLFAENGFERTTTAMICDAIGMSPGRLYHYFSGKKALFIAVLTADRQETGEVLGELRRREAPLEALLAFVEHLAAPATVHPLVSQLVLEAMMQARRDEEVRTILEQVDDEERAGVEELLVRAVESGEADAGLEPREAAQWIMTLIGAMYLGVLDGDTSMDLLAQLRRTVRGYLAPACD
ncbi:TetR/AcrR family transcriptional regulator [Brevibacterium jeotgali]|uniref:Transcriptional regulator, TetR family n=1 Tax=Brevibacterium jeotgali TaxID=1262550 RepID=A0A2H1L8H5_9MICO|nr:TetR/AcrR family transcriptional regulator [Brevibacterium jeotgali]TWB98812.1 TetR family transcriptional regulator [Brevibacterium jeotgali]SMY13169.1 transcriptional regulator, TetR family [Brevibacterium jeotgali]